MGLLPVVVARPAFARLKRTTATCFPSASTGAVLRQTSSSLPQRSSGPLMAWHLLKSTVGTGWRCSVPRVLIVDDEENQRRTLSIALRLEGFDVVLASSS